MQFHWKKILFDDFRRKFSNDWKETREKAEDEVKNKSTDDFI